MLKDVINCKIELLFRHLFLFCFGRARVSKARYKSPANLISEKRGAYFENL